MEHKKSYIRLKNGRIENDRNIGNSISSSFNQNLLSSGLRIRKNTNILSLEKLYSENKT